MHEERQQHKETLERTSYVGTRLDKQDDKIDALLRDTIASRAFWKNKFIYSKITSLAVIAVLSCAFGAISYISFDKIQDQESIDSKQELVIDQIRKKIVQLELDYAVNQATRSESQNSDDVSAHCTCVAKDNAKTPRTSICPARNNTCDEESSKLCETIKTGYEC
jgi:hypothetical protein